MRHTTPPPVPQRLRDMLKDHPEHIQILQADLSRVVEKPSKGVPMFEQAIWALEGGLDAFIDEARRELASAHASRDPVAIEQAEAKERLMSRARPRIAWLGDAELSEYFRATGRSSR